MVHFRILLCTYNGAKWLETQLASYLSQTHPSWSIWVSDDGSTDETLAILDRFRKQHPDRLDRIVEGPHKGSAANYLSLLCHPELPSGYVALSDQDDIWLPEKLERAASAIGTGPEGQPRAYSAAYFTSDFDRQRHIRSEIWDLGPKLQNAAVQNIMSGHTTVLNPAALDAVRSAGRVDVAHHDWWIYLLMTGIGAEIKIDPVPVIHYRQHSDAAMGSRQGLRAVLRRARFISSRSYAAWVEANLAALLHSSHLLTPEARSLARDWTALSCRFGPQRVAALRQMGLVRQSPAETGFLYLAAGLGMV